VFARSAAILLIATLASIPATPFPAPAPDRRVPALGLAVNVADSASAPDRQEALDQVRAAGVSLFALEVAWPAAEPRPRRYDVAAVTRTARLLRQSGAVLHLDLPLVNGRIRQVPADLARAAFDDPKLTVRLGRLLDALGPALADFSTLSLGNEADAYFSDKPDELRAFRSLFRGAVEFLGKKTPRLLVGVATNAPMDSRFPAVVSAIQEKSPVLLYVYSPFLPDAPFRHRPPETIDRDWATILSAASGRPVAFTEVSFSSAGENDSSVARQADFVRRMRRILGREDAARLLFARYVPWRDPAPVSASPAPPRDPLTVRRDAFFANRGLQTAEGRPKPAWKEFAAPPPEPGRRLKR
jgi:hypothetical protein